MGMETLGILEMDLRWFWDGFIMAVERNTHG